MLQGTGNPHTSCIILRNAVNKWLLFIWWMGNEKMLYLPKLLLLLFLMLTNGHNVSMLLYVPVEYNKFPLIYLWKSRVQRKSFLQVAIRASWSLHLLAQTSFELAPKAFWHAELISQFLCYSHSHSSKNISCPSGKLKTEFTSPIAKSTSHGLSDTTFFAHWKDAAKQW